MPDPIEPIVTPLGTSLNPAPLFTQRGELERQNPQPPYALLQPISQPEDPNAFDAVLVFGLTVWAPLWQLFEVMAEIEWLDGHQEGDHAPYQNLRYTRAGRTYSAEPDLKMPDGVTEVWNLSDTYRCQYADFTFQAQGGGVVR